MKEPESSTLSVGSQSHQSAPPRNADASQKESHQFKTLESTVGWIEQDSTSKPNEYLEDCDTQIFGE
ncbi:MAG: hypothetical protein ABL921_23730 [Pirellula sp.]